MFVWRFDAGRRQGVGSLIALALTLGGCGGRSTNHDLSEPPQSESLPNVGELVRQRCADFALPDAEPSKLGRGGGKPIFGACGHLYTHTLQGTDVYSPDLKTVVAHSLDEPRFSPEGTRLAFTPGGTESGIVRRLDLVSGAAFDTRLFEGSEHPSDLDYGLFLAKDGTVRSWLCNDHTLRIFRDREQDQRPSFESNVARCPADVKAENALLWHEGNAVHAVDLLAERVHDLELAEFGGRPADRITAALGGYAVAIEQSDAVFVGDLFETTVSTGPLYSIRTGEEIVPQWERVSIAPGHTVTNGFDPYVGMLFDDGTSIRSLPRVRGIYVFDDGKRAFGLKLDASGATLVVADVVTGSLEELDLSPGNASYVAGMKYTDLGVSPDETAAYLLRPASLVGVVPDTLSMVRWLDGASERLPPRSGRSFRKPLVGNGGQAVVDSLVFRPGQEIMSLPVTAVQALDADGTYACARLEVLGEAAPGEARPITHQLALFELETGAKRAVIDGITIFEPIVTDRAHNRLAFIAQSGDVASPYELWAGRFP